MEGVIHLEIYGTYVPLLEAPLSTYSLLPTSRRLPAQVPCAKLFAARTMPNRFPKQECPKNVSN